jgi:hypothetical protein
MKSLIVAVTLVMFALLACKHAGPQPQSPVQQNAAAPDAQVADAAPPDAQPTDAETAAEAVTFECDGDAGSCYEQAQARCPGGYDEVEKHEQAVGGAEPRAGKTAMDLFKPKHTGATPPPPATTHTRLVVRCRAAATDAGLLPVH